MSDRRLGSLVVEDEGDGPAVLMLHGLGGTSNTFAPLMSVLGGYRVLRPDLPGAGRSALRPGVATLDGLVGAVRDVLRLTAIERAHVVAHSMGALVAQHLAATEPHRVASLALIGPLLEPPASARAALRERAAAAARGEMAAVADAVANASVATNAHCAARAFVRESVLRQDPAGYARHCHLLSEAHAADHARIECPTSLLVGSDDPVSPPAMVHAIADAIDGARIQELPGVGHWPSAEAPDRTRAWLAEHMAELD